MTQNPLQCPNVGGSSLRAWIDRSPGDEPVLRLQQAWNADSGLAGGTVRLGWNGRGLLLHATLPDRDIFNPVTAFNEPAYMKGDVFEIFLRPLSQVAYYEIHISPSNQRYQVRFPKSPRDELPGENVTLSFVTVEVNSQIRIDRPNERWEVFAQIPLGPLCENEPFKPDSHWLVSFSRYDYTRTPEGMHSELFSTSPHKTPDFHRQQEWTLLTFGAP